MRSFDSCKSALVVLLLSSVMHSSWLKKRHSAGAIFSRRTKQVYVNSNYDAKLDVNYPQRTMLPQFQ